MPTYKVTYFDIRGYAELTRLALSAAKQEFEDVRVSSETWKELKPTLPLGQIPILEVDGTIIAQSGAMARYVAREHDLYGKGNMEMTMVDVVLETLNDFSKERMKSMFEKDEEEKQKLTKVFDGETVPRFLAVFEKMLGEDDWMVGSKLSLADLAVFNAFEAIAKTVMEESGNDIYAGYPKLKVHADRVKSVEHVKIWLDTRPKTKF